MALHESPSVVGWDQVFPKGWASLTPYASAHNQPMKNYLSCLAQTSVIRGVGCLLVISEVGNKEMDAHFRDKHVEIMTGLIEKFARWD